MKKSELIKQLEAIEGDPEVVVVAAKDGTGLTIDEVEEGVYETGKGGHVYTFSKEKKQEEPELEDCIILWI